MTVTIQYLFVSDCLCQQVDVRFYCFTYTYVRAWVKKLYVCKYLL